MKITRAIIPAAGAGSRLKLLNPAVPKEWLPIGGKPMIAYALEEIAATSIRDVVLVLSPEKLANWETWHRESRVEALCRRLNVEVVVQPFPLGLADAIGRGRDRIGDHPFAIVLPDNLLLSREPAALSHLLGAFDRFQKHIAGLTLLSGGRERFFSDSGRVDLRKTEDRVYRITCWYPKCPGHFKLRNPEGEMRSIGRHAALPDFFAYLDMVQASTSTELDDGPVFVKMLEHDTVYGLLLDDEVYDAGNPSGYERAKRIVESKER